MTYSSSKTGGATAALLLITAILTGNFAFFPMTHAAAADVVIDSSSQGAAQINSGQTNTLTATFRNTGSSSESVLLDLELHRQESGGGTTRQTQHFQEVSLAAGVTHTLTLTSPSDLSNGTYVWKSGIFTSSWGSLVRWHDSLHTFSVGTGGSGTSDNQIFLSSSSQTATQISVGQSNNFEAFISNTGNTSRSVLLDAELYGPNGQRVAQNFMETTVQAGGSTSLTLSSGNLTTPGTYIWKVGIFDPGWSRTIHWYDRVREFTVSGQSGNGDVTLASSTIHPAQDTIERRDMEVVVLTANFTTPNPPSRPVLIDLEVYNQQGQRVAQSFRDNVVVTSTISHSVVMDRTLPAGMYTFEVGIFNPGWAGLLHWYDDVRRFSLSDTAPTQPSILLHPEESNDNASHYQLVDAQTNTYRTDFKVHSCDLIALAGSNFAADETVRVENSATPGNFFETQASGQGSVENEFPLVAGSLPSEFTLTVTGMQSNFTKRFILQRDDLPRPVLDVQSSAQSTIDNTPCRSGSIFVNVPQGSTITLTGENFAANETVNIYREGVATPVLTTTVNGSGAFGPLNFTYQQGPYHFAAVGQTSGRVAHNYEL